MRTLQMTEAHNEFLRAVRDRLPIHTGTNADDRLRRQCKQIGWVEYLPRLKRWNLTELGATYMRNVGL